MFHIYNIVFIIIRTGTKKYVKRRVCLLRLLTHPPSAYSIEFVIYTLVFKQIIHCYLALYHSVLSILNQSISCNECKMKSLVRSCYFTKQLSPTNYMLKIRWSNLKRLHRELHLAEVYRLVASVYNQIYLSAFTSFAISIYGRKCSP